MLTGAQSLGALGWGF